MPLTADAVSRSTDQTVIATDDPNSGEAKASQALAQRCNTGKNLFQVSLSIWLLQMCDYPYYAVGADT